MSRSVSWVTKVQNGRIPLDRAGVVLKLAEVLGVETPELTGQPYRHEPQRSTRATPPSRDYGWRCNKPSCPAAPLWSETESRHPCGISPDKSGWLRLCAIFDPASGASPWTYILPYGILTTFSFDIAGDVVCLLTGAGDGMTGFRG
jgi:hypothetical protein